MKAARPKKLLWGPTGGFVYQMGTEQVKYFKSPPKDGYRRWDRRDRKDGTIVYEWEFSGSEFSPGVVAAIWKPMDYCTDCLRFFRTEDAPREIHCEDHHHRLSQDEGE